MAAVRSKDTAPEMSLRRALFRKGYRYRLHRKDLPGKPDMVFPKYHAVVFVNGCFWHYHECSRGKVPATRKQWWKAKLTANARRDARVGEKLQREGWRVAVLWECSIRRPGLKGDAALNRVSARVAKFLLSDRQTLVMSGPLVAEVPKGGC